MSDDLLVSGGGTTVVASDAILARLDSLAGIGTALHSAAAELEQLEAESRSSALRAACAGLAAAATTLGLGAHALDDARRSAAVTAERSHALGVALRSALAAYGAADAVATAASRQASATGAWWLGRFASIALLPFALELGVGELAVGATTGLTPAEQAQALVAYLRRHPGVLTSPQVVDGIQATTENLDDFGAGMIGVPPELAHLVETATTGTQGAPFSAAVILVLARSFGVLGETGVHVRRATTSVGAVPPASLRERFDRLPHVDREPGGEQVRIDRYRTPGLADRFDVYVAGTADFSLASGSQPFDMTSNVAGVAHASPASYRAVLSAMKQAGITADSPVQLTGYSQGGLIASLVAGSGRFDVKSLVTFGAPAGEVPIAPDIPVLTVRHTDDLVPASGGYDTNPQAMVIERTVFDDRAIPNDLPVPAHQSPYYDRTATLIDHARSEAVRSAVTRIDDFGANATEVQTTTWLALRTPP